MELIFNNQLSILIDILPFYLTPKQCIKYYSSNLILYNIYNTNNKFENYYFTPKTNEELEIAVNTWCSNKEEAIIKYSNIEYWNTIYITDMNELFEYKYNFNDNISDWNTSNVTCMYSMFYQAYKFNQSLNNWNVSNVINIEYMFYSAINFNQNLNNWNLSNIKYTYHIFDNCKNFNKLNCKDWNLNHISDYIKINMFGYKN